MMKAAVLSQLSTAQRSYKREINKKTRQEPTFKVGDYVFEYWPQVTAFVAHAANKMATLR